MAQTQVVIVYSPNQNKRRTVIIPDDDSQIAAHAANIAAGESILIGSLSDYLSLGPDAMLLAHTGKPPTSDRCVIHNGSVVVAVVCADPLIDSPQPIAAAPGKSMAMGEMGALSAQPTTPVLTMIADDMGKARVGYAVVNGVVVIPPTSVPDAAP